MKRNTADSLSTEKERYPIEKELDLITLRSIRRDSIITREEIIEFVMYDTFLLKIAAMGGIHSTLKIISRIIRLHLWPL
jgi:hypothetical protein